jgi:Transposase DDE domain
MTQYSLLERTLAENLSWNRARIKFLSNFLLALFAARTVNLAQIATFFVGRATTESNYKRIKRFLRFFEISEREVARLVIRLMKLEPPFVITIDRTEWQLGKTWVNVLMLAIVSPEGVAVPLLWTVFSKKGCSNDSERQEILERYLAVFGAESISFVTADREFASSEWLKFLNRKGIGFCLRIKANTRITDKRGKPMKARRLLSRGKIGEAINCRRRRKLWNVPVRLSGRRKACGDNVIVVSSENVAELLSSYRLRWQIETLFGCLKSRGFCLEATHLTETERISRLLSVLALAFCWAMLSGQMATARKPLKRKKHGRLERSVFRAGIDYLRRLLCRPGSEGEKQEKQQLILLLSRT